MSYLDRFYSSADGLQLYARDYPGPTPEAACVLCLPGLTRNSRDFARLAEALSARYRVICPDQRGRGRSARDPDPSHYRPDVYVGDMLGLLDLLEVSEARVIGTSLGGLMAVVMAAMQPARVHSVLLNDVGPELDPRGVARIRAYVGKSAADLTLAQAVAAVAVVNAGAFPDFTPADWLDLLMNNHVMQGQLVVADYDPLIAQAAAAGTAALDLWPLFGALAAKPTLLLRGALSDLLSAATVAKMCAQMPGLRALEIPNRGHAPSLDEAPARAAIWAWLAGAEQGA